MAISRQLAVHWWVVQIYEAMVNRSLRPRPNQECHIVRPTRQPASASA